MQSPPGTMLRLTRRQGETEQSAGNHAKVQGDLRVGLTSTVDLRPHLDSVDITEWLYSRTPLSGLYSACGAVPAHLHAWVGSRWDESGNLWALSESATVMTALDRFLTLPHSQTPPSSLLLLRYLYRLCGLWCFQISDKS